MHAENSVESSGSPLLYISCFTFVVRMNNSITEKLYHNEKKKKERLDELNWAVVSNSNIFKMQILVKRNFVKLGIKKIV